MEQKSITKWLHDIINIYIYDIYIFYILTLGAAAFLAFGSGLGGAGFYKSIQKLIRQREIRQIYIY